MHMCGSRNGGAPRGTSSGKTPYQHGFCFQLEQHLINGVEGLVFQGGLGLEGLAERTC